MASTPPVPSTSGTSSKGYKTRRCSACNKRMSSLLFDRHTICSDCWGRLCGFDLKCSECEVWDESFFYAYVQHSRSLKIKRESKNRLRDLSSKSDSSSSMNVDDRDVRVIHVSSPFSPTEVSTLPSSIPVSIFPICFYIFIEII